MIQHAIIPDNLIKKISEYLNPLFNPDVFTMNQLDGFLFCISISSPLIPHSQIIASIFGSSEPSFDTLEDVADFNRYLEKYLNLYAKALKNNSLKFPFKIDANKINDDIVHAIQDWCYGFFRGFLIGHDDWLPPDKQILEKLSVKEKVIYECIFLVYMVAYTLHHDKMPVEKNFHKLVNIKKFKDELITNILILPDALRVLVEYGKQMKSIIVSQHSGRDKKEPHVKIGRNDPCPCGSGIKYKKCCGKNV